MTKKAKLIRNLFVLLVLILIIKTFSFGSFTALSAFKKGERAANYGPSRIVKTIELDGKVLYLSKYDKWYSLSTVRKGFLGLWYPDYGFHGVLYNEDAPIELIRSTSESSNHVSGIFHGIVNDPNIKSVKCTIKIDDRIKELEQKELYENLILLTVDEAGTNFEIVNIVGLDKDSKVIYEENF